MPCILILNASASIATTSGFDQYEHDYLQSLANLIGTSPATLIRQLALKQALADITLEPQLMTPTATNPDDKQTL